MRGNISDKERENIVAGNRLFCYKSPDCDEEQCRCHRKLEVKDSEEIQDAMEDFKDAKEANDIALRELTEAIQWYSKMQKNMDLEEERLNRLLNK